MPSSIGENHTFCCLSDFCDENWQGGQASRVGRKHEARRSAKEERKDGDSKRAHVFNLTSYTRWYRRIPTSCIGEGSTRSCRSCWRFAICNSPAAIRVAVSAPNMADSGGLRHRKCKTFFSGRMYDVMSFVWFKVAWRKVHGNFQFRVLHLFVVAVFWCSISGECRFWLRQRNWKREVTLKLRIVSVQFCCWWWCFRGCCCWWWWQGLFCFSL